MEIIAGAVGLVVGISVGAIVGYLLSKSRFAGDLASAREKAARAEEAESKIEELSRENAALREEASRMEATLEAEKKAAAERLSLLEDAKNKLADSFKALSSDALKSNNEAFLKLARETLSKAGVEARGDLDKRKQAIENLVKPIGEKLKEYDEYIRRVEKERAGSYEKLYESVVKLGRETDKLVTALRRPEVRGRWGELTLRRTVELAGLAEHCDFTEQVTTSGGDGSKLRPDMVVHLPGERDIIVDSKVPLDAFMNAMDAESKEQKEKELARHADQLRAKAKELGKKQYWEHFENTALFAVMFLPSEAILRAALDKHPGLLEESLENRVIITTPSNLVALLLVVAHGWQQEKLKKYALEINDLGKQLFERIGIFADHMADLRKNIGRSVDSFNRAVGSLETRVLVSARKFKELGVKTSAEICEVGVVEKTPRMLSEQPENEDG